jgi:hypothetical protein
MNFSVVKIFFQPFIPYLSLYYQFFVVDKKYISKCNLFVFFDAFAGVIINNNKESVGIY